MKARKINVIVPFSRPAMLDNVINNFLRQHYSNKRLILVENGPAIGACIKKGVYPDLLLQSEPHQSFAKNTALEELRKIGGFWTTFDDDDYYGPSYLEELAEFSNKATIIGKFSHFMLTTENALRLYLSSRENRLTRFVHGPTISAWAEDSVDFKDTGRWGEDNDWIDRMTLKGALVYATSRWNFVFQRSKHQHTWLINDSQITQTLFKVCGADLEVREYEACSYEHVNKIAPEPIYSLIKRMPYDAERDNPAYAVRHLVIKDQTEELMKLGIEIMNKIKSTENNTNHP